MTANLIQLAAICIECGRAYEALPKGFVYDDPASGWVQDPGRGTVSGYCEPCADRIAAAYHEDHINGNWERRTIEDEMYVWDR